MNEFDKSITWTNGDKAQEPESPNPNTKAAELNRALVLKLEAMSNTERQELVLRNRAIAFDEGLRIGDTPVPLIPFPILQDRESIARHAKDILHIHKASLKIEDFAFSEHREGRVILDDVQSGMFTEGRQLMMAARNVPHNQALRRVIRFDTFYSGDGFMHMIEANTIATEGILYHDITTRTGLRVLREMGMQNDEFVDEQKVTAARQVFATLCEMTMDRKKHLPDSIGVVYEPEGEDNEINATELPYLAEVFPQMGREIGKDIKIVIGRPKEVDAQDGKMTINGQEVDVIWRNNINPQDYVGLSTNGGTVNVDGLLEVISHPETYLILNDDRTRFQGYKETMAYLHDPRIQRLANLTPDEIKAINNIIPFTFDPSAIENIELRGKSTATREFLLQYADHFVIKPKVGTHGAGVVFGINNGPAWNDAVDAAIDGGKMIAQQYIPYQTITYQTPTVDVDGNFELVDHYMDTNMHVIGGRVPGTNICRSSPTERFHKELGVLNVAAGGGLRPSIRI